jgi:hypothetical protein
MADAGLRWCGALPRQPKEILVIKSSLRKGSFKRKTSHSALQRSKQTRSPRPTKVLAKRPARAPANISATITAKAAARSKPPAAGRSHQDAGRSKQASVIALLQSSSGATLAAMTGVTGWQPHTVRGFLAGVVRKRLKLRLVSEKIDSERI